MVLCWEISGPYEIGEGPESGQFEYIAGLLDLVGHRDLSLLLDRKVAGCSNLQRELCGSLLVGRKDQI